MDRGTYRELAASFPGHRRVRKRREFLAIQSGGLRLASKSFLIMVARRAPDGPARIGITVTRKYGPAVQRNRFKRLTREIFRRNPQWFPQGTDIVVIAKTRLPTFGLAQLLGEWQTLAPRLQARSASLPWVPSPHAPALPVVSSESTPAESPR